MVGEGSLAVILEIYHLIIVSCSFWVYNDSRKFILLNIFKKMFKGVWYGKVL